jgi:broad specificity phosphatase PhoE
MALVILVRHGQTDENVSGKISGQGAVPLSARGREQAQLAAEVLAGLGVTHLFCSPVARARQTADILAQRLGLDITAEIPDLREVEYGEWEGRFFHEIRQSPIAQQVFHDPINAVFPNGESLPAVQQRGVQVIERIRQQYPQGVLVLVSHGDVIRTVLAHYLDMTFNEYGRINLDLGALSVLELYDDWIRIKTVNFVPQPGKLWLASTYPTWKKRPRLAPLGNTDAGAELIEQHT